MSVMEHFVRWFLGWSEAETQTTCEERDCLARHARGKLRIAEIGVWHGVTTRCLLSVMHPSGLLYAIDPYPAGRLGFNAQRVIARREVAKASNGAVLWLRCTGVEAAAQIASTQAGKMDLVFIDGDHSYRGLREDWESWSPLIGAGGVICIHDSCSSIDREIDGSGSALFTRDVITNDVKFRRIEVVDTLSVFQRRQEAAGVRDPRH